MLILLIKVLIINQQINYQINESNELFAPFLWLNQWKYRLKDYIQDLSYDFVDKYPSLPTKIVIIFINDIDDYFGVGYKNCIFGYNNCGMVQKLIELIKMIKMITERVKMKVVKHIFEYRF